MIGAEPVSMFPFFLNACLPVEYCDLSKTVTRCRNERCTEDLIQNYSTSLSCSVNDLIAGRGTMLDSYIFS